jgi:hypothetical protein
VDLQVRRFASGGSPLGPVTTVSSSEFLGDLAIAGDEAGRFVVVWSTDQNRLRAQIFSPE